MRLRFWLVMGLLTLVLAACGQAGPSSEGPPATAANPPTKTPAPTPAAEPTPPATAPASPSPTPLPPEPTEPVAATPTAAAQPAANADVLFVRAVQTAANTWTFHVTVQHPDSGWEDYADGWDVLTPAGTVLKPDPSSPFTRLLLHPHEQEQPFTRSQSGIVIPPEVTQVRVRAHDLVDGYGGREVVVDLAGGTGPDFEVERTK